MAGRTTTYREAGVDIDAGGLFVQRIKSLVRRTEDTRVLHGLGGFAGMFALDYGNQIFRRSYQNPVLVACTDGVGTKLNVAAMMKKHDTIGIDLVAMSVNDLVCTGAEPLFFLDYLATPKLDVDVAVEVVKGISMGCREAGCTLLGGETAEHPGEKMSAGYDLAGFAVGVVERTRIIDGSRIREGDEIIGIGSSGLHSNGYSLARKALVTNRRSLTRKNAALGRSLGEELLQPTRIYASAVAAMLRPYKKKQVLHGLAHITGGGLIENAPRVFVGSSGKGLRLRLERESWPRPPVFDLLMEAGIERQEMFRVFNMGVGLIAIVPEYFRRAAMRRLARHGYDAWVIGRVEKGRGSIVIEELEEDG